MDCTPGLPAAVGYAGHVVLQERLSTSLPRPASSSRPQVLCGFALNTSAAKAEALQGLGGSLQGCLGHSPREHPRIASQARSRPYTYTRAHTQPVTQKQAGNDGASRWVHAAPMLGAMLCARCCGRTGCSAIALPLSCPAGQAHMDYALSGLCAIGGIM